MAISPRFPAPRGGRGRERGSEGVETVSRGPRVDSNLPPPFLSTANRSAPTFERTVNLPTKWHSPRSVSLLPIPVTAEDDGHSRATPGPPHIYIYILVQLPRFLFPDSPITSSFYFSLPSPPLFLLHRVEKNWSNAFPSKYLPILACFPCLSGEGRT